MNEKIIVLGAGMVTLRSARNAGIFPVESLTIEIKKFEFEDPGKFEGDATEPMPSLMKKRKVERLAMIKAKNMGRWYCWYQVGDHWFCQQYDVNKKRCVGVAGEGATRDLAFADLQRHLAAVQARETVNADQD